MVEGNLKTKPRRPRTTLAFLLFPGIAALAIAALAATETLLTGSGASIGKVVVAAFYTAYGIAIFGYAMVLIIAVPLYVLLGVIKGNLTSKPRHPRTSLAFLLSPGITALAVATLWAVTAVLPAGLGPSISIGNVIVGVFYIASDIAIVGYATALIIAVPLYRLLPERTRRTALIVVPLAGAIAAVPWIPLFAYWGFVALPVGIIFGLGCLTGMVFLMIRGASASGDFGQDD